MASDERVLEKGTGWEIVKTKSTIEICFYCANCGHRIARRSHYGSVFWRHSYPENNKGYTYSAICKLCSCERPTPPSMEEQNKAYAILQQCRKGLPWKPNEIDI